MQTALSDPSTTMVPATRRVAASSHDSSTRITPPPRLRFDPAQPRTLPLTGNVEPAIQGNHLAVHTLLQRILHRPANVEFASALMRPNYDPAERLIVKSPSDRRLVAHIQVMPHSIHFGRVEIPIARMRDIAVVPEFRQRGLAGRLLLAAEEKAKRDGAMLLVAHGEDVSLLQKHGWISLGSDPISMVSPQRLMGQLPPRAVPESPFYASQMPQEEVRIGRLTDLDIVKQMYEQRFSDAFGSFVRDADYWSWLLKKGCHDRMYLYLEDSKPLGYVVVRGASVLELIDLTDDSRASGRLLEHVGADAIEQGRHSLRIHAPLSEQAHQWADAAGGQLFAGMPSDAWMVKVPSVRTLLRRLATEMHRRNAKRPMELSVRIGNEELMLKSGVRSMKITRAVSAKHRIGLTAKAAAQLLLGYRTVADLAAQKKLVASSDEAMKMATALFPNMELWRNQWDEVSAIDA